MCYAFVFRAKSEKCLERIERIKQVELGYQQVKTAHVKNTAELVAACGGEHGACYRIVAETDHHTIVEESIAHSKLVNCREVYLHLKHNAVPSTEYSCDSAHYCCP